MAYLYANDGLVASTQKERLQWAFDILADLFDQIYLRTNTRKTVRMYCQTCHIPVKMLVVAYERRTTGTGLTYK